MHYSYMVNLYAAAFFDHVLKVKALEEYFTQVRDLKIFLEKDKSLVSCVAAPIYSVAQQKVLLSIIVKRFNFLPYMNNLLMVLADNKRLNLILPILDCFITIANVHLGIKFVEVTSSEDISNESQAELKSKIEKIISAKIELSLNIDPSIIGGLIIKFDNKMIDMSLRSQFQHLLDAAQKKIALL